MAWKIVNNADSGTSTTFGGNDGDKISQLFSGITIADIPDINTNFRFRDDRFRLRNPANTFDYIFSTAAISADRTLNVPLITGTDTLAVLGLAQTFSNKTLDATCSFAGSIALPSTVVETDQANVYGDFSQTFKDNRIFINNPADTFAYRIIAQAISGNRDLNLPLITGTDTLAAVGINNNFSAAQTIIPQAGSSDALYLKRTDTSAPGTNMDINWEFQDSLGNYDQFCDIRTAVVDNTSGSESAEFFVNLMYQGTKVTRLNIDEDGELNIINATSGRTIDLIGQYGTNGNTNDIEFRMWDSTSADTSYAQLRAVISDNTNTSEDGYFDIRTITGGTLTTSLRTGNDTTGALDIGNNLRLRLVETGLSSQRTFTFPNATTQLAGVGVSNTFTTNQVVQGLLDCGGANARIRFDETGLSAQRTFTFPNNSTELAGYANTGTFTALQTIQANLNELIQLYRTSNTAFDEIALSYYGQDSGAAKQFYGSMSVEMMDTSAGSEDGQIDWDLVRGGTSQRVMRLDNTGELTIGRDSSNHRSVNTTLTDSSAEVTGSNSTSEITVVSFTVKGNTIGVDGSVHLIINGTLTQNQATATTYTMRIKVGGTTIYEDGIGGSLAQSGTERPWVVNVFFHPSNQSGTTGRMFGWFMMNDTSTPTTGQGQITDDESQAMANFKSSSYSWTTANDTTMSVTMQMSVASTSTTWRKDYHLVKQYFS